MNDHEFEQAIRGALRFDSGLPSDRAWRKVRMGPPQRLPSSSEILVAAAVSGALLIAFARGEKNWATTSQPAASSILTPNAGSDEAKLTIAMLQHINGVR